MHLKFTFLSEIEVGKILYQGAVINYDIEGGTLSCGGLKFFPANLLGSEAIDKHLVGVSN